jgi:hypothetical protein
VRRLCTLQGWRVVGVLTARGAADESDKPSTFSGGQGALCFISSCGGRGARWAAADPARRNRCLACQHFIILLLSQELGGGAIDIVDSSVTWCPAISDISSRNTIDLPPLLLSAATQPPLRAVNSQSQKAVQTMTRNWIRRFHATTGSVATGHPASTS